MTAERKLYEIENLWERIRRIENKLLPKTRGKRKQWLALLQKSLIKRLQRVLSWDCTYHYYDDDDFEPYRVFRKGVKDEL